MPDRSYEFVQLDVFTKTPLAANPLAIFTDARGLDGLWGQSFQAPTLINFLSRRWEAQRNDWELRT